MTVEELFHSGKLTEAIQMLGREVRDYPLDSKRRTFLFGLLCFAGEFDRAEKHLNILADSSESARLGSFLYLSAVHAERSRQKMFADRTFPAANAFAELQGERNGAGFSSFSDADDRIGGSLEVFVAGSYIWLSMEQIASIEVRRPKKLTDLLWVPAVVTLQPEYQALKLGEVLLPVLSPLTWTNPDDAVRLGRCTVWEESADAGGIPFGQKIFLIDELDVPLLELGKIDLSAALGGSRAASA